jgi:hypothetical protein
MFLPALIVAAALLLILARRWMKQMPWRGSYALLVAAALACAFIAGAVLSTDKDCGLLAALQPKDARND